VGELFYVVQCSVEFELADGCCIIKIVDILDSPLCVGRIVCLKQLFWTIVVDAVVVAVHLAVAF